MVTCLTAFLLQDDLKFHLFVIPTGVICFSYVISFNPDTGVSPAGLIFSEQGLIPFSLQT